CGYGFESSPGLDNGSRRNGRWWKGSMVESRLTTSIPFFLNRYPKPDRIQIHIHKSKNPKNTPKRNITLNRIQEFEKTPKFRVKTWQRCPHLTPLGSTSEAEQVRPAVTC